MTKILVVEDEKAVLENTMELLQEEGYEVEGARDGEEAYRKVITSPPDLILCDVRMPKLDGLGLLSRLSQSATTAKIPVIFITALSERSDLRAGMELGADDYITKPFLRDDVLAAITRRLEKKQLLEDRVKLEMSVQVGAFAHGLPFECQTTITKISKSLEWIEGKAHTDTGLAAAAQAIRQELNLFTHLVNNYQTLMQMADSEHKARPSSRTFDAQNIKPLLEEICWATAWQFHRERDVRLSVDDARLAVADDILQRVVEEMLISAFTRTEVGEPIRVLGALKPNRKGYLLHIEWKGTTFTDEQLAFSEHPEWVPTPDIHRIGIGLVVIAKWMEQVSGRFSLLNLADEGSRFEVFIPMVRKDVGHV